MPMPFGQSQFRRTPATYVSDPATLLHAANAIANARRVATKNKSSVVVVGPFETQVYDFSSGSDSGSSSCRPSLHITASSGEGTASSPSTSVKWPGKTITASNLLAQNPVLPDWVEYSRPIEDFDGIDMGNASETDCESTLESHQFKFKDTGADNDMYNAGPDEEWNPLYLQTFHYQRPQSAAPAAYSRSLRREEIIPVQVPSFEPKLPFAYPSAQMNLSPVPVPMFDSVTRSSSASHDAVETNDPDASNHSDGLLKVQKASILYTGSCTACESTAGRMVHILPCGDLACQSCFSSSVAAVSVSRGQSKCPACLEVVTSFQPYNGSRPIPVKPVQRRISQGELSKPGQTVVMRIDNVAWDVEPHIVEDFLPPNTLPSNHPHPIHICIDRLDGRTKDYMYVEVQSILAAKRVLQKCQNTYMSGGRVTRGRKRAVTISIVTHDELLNELRPAGKDELISLLDLCVATLSAPTPTMRIDSKGRGRLHAVVSTNGKVHYIKYRHAPFHALTSILCKLRGKDSPAYWDLFHVASGALIALSSSLKVQGITVTYASDIRLKNRLLVMFDRCFGEAARPIQL
ncbi:hypothetical protein CspeluHIS016_0109300 [Cutaneotrichosporon spelunceum]|uniref:RING-type domain-containing protein n=1 Tax=Cutaneotrichosporon spelunceum TaxID=1672016 RepID=A0AAD3TPK1_9TREE|nr:hypothetical protein CspeluHIS016_0109300 [Cutaneotrichosporon spelunceum]